MLETEPDLRLQHSEDLESFAVGHRADTRLKPQDEELYRAFQANLLSLISHELRTPLTGILNALSVLNEQENFEGVPVREMVGMAVSNAQRLHHSLSSLLDLAAIETGVFRVRLKEVDFLRVAADRVRAFEPRMRERSLRWKISRSVVKEAEEGTPLLGDPQKLSRAVELCLEILLNRAEAGTDAKFEIEPDHYQIEFQLQSGTEAEWERDWSQALAGFRGGVASPVSAFAGTVRSEREFLTRTREGLGSEFLLIHEILRLHRGKFTQRCSGRTVRLRFEVPRLESEEAVRAVLTSRAYEATSGLQSIAFGLIAVPEGEDARGFRRKLKGALFRSSDAVYLLEDTGRLALVMDDCKKEDAPGLLSRIERALGQKLVCGLVHCPEDGADPAVLLKVAAARLRRTQ